MKYRNLGRTELRVSEICLGTMTWGEQNTPADAFTQLDVAMASGVNFIDTAELYPVPPRPQTQGRTEQILGDWLRRRGRRDDLVIATKVVGRNNWNPSIRGGIDCLDRANIEAALNASLKRLRTDYIDLYQLHWPDRRTNFFGRLGYQHPADDTAIPPDETLRVLSDQIRAGKIRHVGLSNETPWGVMKFLQLAEQHGLPRMVAVQNPYSLLNRSFEIGLAEIAHREDCGLLAYSPLGFGVLSGKYLGGARPAGARMTLFTRFTRYDNPQAYAATQAYVDLAQHHGLDPAQMALAYVHRRPFLTSTIIGARTLEQLRDNLASIELTLGDTVLAGIEAIHQRHPNPAP